MKAILLAAVAAAVMGGFTVASSGLLRKRPPGVGAVSPSAIGRGRDSEQLLVGPNTTPPHGISATGNAERSVVAGPTVEHAAEEQHHELILAPPKVWCRQRLDPQVGLGYVLWGGQRPRIGCGEAEVGFALFYYCTDRALYTVDAVFVAIVTDMFAAFARNQAWLSLAP